MGFNKTAKYPSKEWAEAILTMGYSWRERLCEHCNDTFIHLEHGGDKPICPYCGRYSSTYAFDYYEHLDRLKEAEKIRAGHWAEMEEKRRKIEEANAKYEFEMRDGYPVANSIVYENGVIKEISYTQYHKEGYNRW